MNDAEKLDWLEWQVEHALWKQQQIKLQLDFMLWEEEFGLA